MCHLLCLIKRKKKKIITEKKKYILYMQACGKISTILHIPKMCSRRWTMVDIHRFNEEAKIIISRKNTSSINFKMKPIFY